MCVGLNIYAELDYQVGLKIGYKCQALWIIEVHSVWNVCLITSIDYTQYIKMQFAAIFVTIVLAAGLNLVAAHPSGGYASPSYGAPVYQAPVYPSPPVTYSYLSPGPVVPCGKNLLLSCQNSVAPVPCQSYAPPAYAAPSYAPAYWCQAL